MTPNKGTTGTTGRVRLGELLVKAGVITDAQLKSALAEQKQWGGKLGDILVRMKYLSEYIFVRALSKQLGLARADLNANIPPEVLSKVPAEVAEEYEIVPVALQDDGKVLAIATADPLNLTVVDYVRTLTKCRVVPQVASASAIRAAIARLYQIDADRLAELKIVNNADDSAFGQTGAPPPRSGLELSPNANVTGPIARASPLASTMSPSVPNPRVTTSPNMAAVTTNPNLGGVPMAAHLTPAPTYQPPVAYAANGHLTPAPGIPLAAYGYPNSGSYPNLQMQPGLGATGPIPVATALTDDAQRREVVALKALVELLVQKGVITLDEYLARLKR